MLMDIFVICGAMVFGQDQFFDTLGGYIPMLLGRRCGCGGCIADSGRSPV